MREDGAARAGATVQGLLALAIWASTVGLSRSLAEQVGALTAAAAALAIGGAASVVHAWARGRGPRAMLGLSRAYLLGCGGLFVAYMACLYAAIGLAADRLTTLVVALLNYLWPALMVVLSVPLLGRRAHRGLLAAGCALALAGTAVAVLGDVGRQPLSVAPAPLLLAAAAGVLWAVYSNLARRLGPAAGGAVPLFLCASAAVLGLLRLAMPEPGAWSGRSVVELAVLSLGPMALAYSLWERGVRRGDHALLGLSSYFVPVASVAFAAGYWAMLPGRHVVLGCALTVAGALVSGRSLAPEEPPRTSPS